MDLFFNENKISRLSACINYVFSFNEIDKVIIGVSSKDQFAKILKIKNSSKYLETFPRLDIVDKNLLIPKYWKL